VICYLALEEYTEKLLKRHLKEDKGNKLVDCYLKLGCKNTKRFLRPCRQPDVCINFYTAFI
jgi:hypothetical protein